MMLISSRLEKRKNQAFFEKINKLVNY